METAILAIEYRHELSFEERTGLLTRLRLRCLDRCNDLGSCLWPDICCHECILEFLPVLIIEVDR